MTAIRNFPDAPLAQRPLGTRISAWVADLWQGVQDIAQQHADREVAALTARSAWSSPALARRLGVAAAQGCSGDKHAHTSLERSLS